jgi:hypothetical protein
MSMMMPPDPGAAPALPLPPGGGGMPPPMDAMSAGAGPIPAEGGMGGLLAALGGGGGAAPEMGGGGPDALGPGEEDTGSLDPIDHIQQAMKHLMMAIAKDEDEERGMGITKGMGALQALLAGEQKKNAQLSQLGG